MLDKKTLLKKSTLAIVFILTFSVLSAVSLGATEKKVEDQGTDYFNVYDPWEGFNRRVYYFNYYADKYLMIPVVDGYRFITPDLAQEGVSNFFENTGNVKTVVNSAAQGKLRKFMRSLGRFSINTILGCFGIFDVASKLGMPKQQEDFGSTLAHYGVKNGPYLVLPLLGPSNLKNAVGMGIDSVGTSQLNPLVVTETIDLNSPELFLLTGINTRSQVYNFRYYGAGTPFEYEYVRFLYTKYREFAEKE